MNALFAHSNRGARGVVKYQHNAAYKYSIVCVGNYGKKRNSMHMPAHAHQYRYHTKKSRQGRQLAEYISEGTMIFMSADCPFAKTKIKPVYHRMLAVRK